MTWEDWTTIVAKLNARWPDQPINAATAAEWWTDLQRCSAGDVWLAVRAHHRTDRGMFRPQLTDIFKGLEAHEHDMNEQRRAQEHAANQLEARRRGGVGPPPEFLQALEIHKETSRPDATDEQRGQAAAMIDALADQLDGRATQRPETAMDATRRCPGCATSPMAGRVPGPPDEDLGGAAVPTLIPCPDCQPSRYAAWQTGTLPARVKTGANT